MIAMVIVSLVAIGITTVYFFKLQNDKYHFKRIQRKQKTVNLSLEYFLNDLSPDEVDDFVSRAYKLADEFGERFIPPGILLEMKSSGGKFHRV